MFITEYGSILTYGLDGLYEHLGEDGRWVKVLHLPAALDFESCRAFVDDQSALDSLVNLVRLKCEEQAAELAKRSLRLFRRWKFCTKYLYHEGEEVGLYGYEYDWNDHDWFSPVAMFKFGKHVFSSFDDMVRCALCVDAMGLVHYGVFPDLGKLKERLPMNKR